MKRALFSAIFILCLVNSSRAQKLDLSLKLDVSPVNKTRFTLNQLSQNAASVIVFFSPECPICNTMIKTVREMVDSFTTLGVRFYIIYPGPYYSIAQLRKFQKAYRIPSDGFRDDKNKLVKLLGAAVMPQVFVVDAEGNIIYSGQIDNSFEDIGKRRSVTTAFYLKDALNAVIEKHKPPVSKTDPVGCFIN